MTNDVPATVIIGGQWGDEGKGRVVDFLSRNCSVIARYSAGSNAGHTIVNDLGRFGLHLVPAGIFNPNTTCIVGNGVVINPKSLLDELAMLNERGVDTSRVRVSDRAHIVMPWHLAIDDLDEKMRGEHAIGTTGTGTGPAFTDKTGRLGVRMIDLVQPESLDQLLSFVLPYKNRIITELYGGEPLDGDQIRDEYEEYGRQLRPYVADTSRL
ncbi:MAG: adenylosuccinate synthase, partial [Chloroflexi bacterium]|nr:adenylosuccinate synthase [Chloroflexota bacterium]